MPPPPRPQKGPSEYIPSKTYPDMFVNMYPGYVPMHRAGCCGPLVPVCHDVPPPDVDPDPPRGCPPKIYRNPPDIDVRGGEHITVERQDSGDNSITIYTVNSSQWPVAIDDASADVLYGDGTPGNPLGVYDFAGATAENDGKPGTVPAPAKGEREFFLKGDGTWSEVTLANQMQSDWANDDDTSPAFIRNRPKLARVATTGNYNDLKNKPSEIPVFSGATPTADGSKGQVPAPKKGERSLFLKGDGTWSGVDIPEQVQSDWNTTDSSSPAYIRNRPQLARVATTGDYGDLINTPPAIPVFSGATQSAAGTPGQVPAPGIEDRNRFLKGDGTWTDVASPEQVQSDWNENDASSPSYIRNRPQLARVATTGDYGDLINTPPEIPVFSGATPAAAGTKGQVPAPAAADRGRFLKGDGTWADIDIPEQVQSDWSEEDSSDPSYIRNRPGTFTGATSSAAGTSGFVPAPAIADKDKVLCGDGTWKDYSNSRACTAEEMSDWLDEVDNENDDNAEHEHEGEDNGR